VAFLVAMAVVWTLTRRPAFRPPQWRTQVVVDWPLGRGPAALGSEVALDGQTYGPLSFAVHGAHLAVVDTYQSRLVWENRWSTPIARWHHVTIADALLETVAWSGGADAWLVTDNERLAIWAVGRSGAQPWLVLPPSRGVTSSLWRLAAAAAGPVFVEQVTLGHGAYRLALIVYNGRGHPERRISTDYAAELPPAESSLLGQVHSFQVSPAGQLYVELGQSNPRTRTVGILNAEATALINPVTLVSPIPIETANLVGVSAKGWIYLAVNVGLAGRSGRILIYGATGRLLHQVAVPPEPVRAAVYAQVLPNGTVLVDESTRTRYRIVAVSPPGIRPPPAAYPQP
jgi:hypothetical protein